MKTRYGPGTNWLLATTIQNVTNLQDVPLRCDQYRESLSARLDGEDAPLSEPVVQTHLQACVACQSWYADVAAMSGALRMQSTLQIPDLTEPILRAALSNRRETPFVELLARAGLLAVAGAQAAMALRVLISGSDPMMGSMHAAHESGAWNLALAIAFLTAAIRPSAASALVPMVGVLTAVLVVFTLSDLSSGHVTMSRVVTHVLMVVGLVLLSTLAFGSTRPRLSVMPRGLVRTR